jgi:hypothetical protein
MNCSGLAWAMVIAFGVAGVIALLDWIFNGKDKQP